ncbi:MAG TPA: DUF454 domain-containing protein, partial [Firmicutes bacterium]|nr:DUF454 domain-containing protein [Bacillota bacterium]
MTIKQKVTILLFADMMLLFPLIILDSWIMKGVIVVLMIIKYIYFMFFISTIPVEDK